MHPLSWPPAGSRCSRPQRSASEQPPCPFWEILAAPASVLQAAPSLWQPSPASCLSLAAAHLVALTGGEKACRGPEGCRPVPSTPVTHFPRLLSAECGHVVSLAPSPGSISSPAQVSCPPHLLPAFQLVPMSCGLCLKMSGMSSLFCLSPGLAFAKSLPTSPPNCPPHLQNLPAGQAKVSSSLHPATALGRGTLHYSPIEPSSPPVPRWGN